MNTRSASQDEMPLWAKQILAQQEIITEKLEGTETSPKTKNWNEFSSQLLKEIKSALDITSITKSNEQIHKILQKYEKAKTNIEILGFTKYDSNKDEETLKFLKIATVLNPRTQNQWTNDKVDKVDIKCYSCGRKGHYANKCQQRGQLKVGRELTLGIKKTIINRAKPAKVKERYLSGEQKHFLKVCVEKLLRENRIEEIRHSEWLSPVQLVKKKDTWRLTVDYKCSGVNDAIENDPYPLPRIFENLQQMTKYKCFDKMDLKNGFWNMEINDEKSKELLAFKVGSKLYTWKVCPQGLKVAPSSFQRAMEEILGEQEGVLVYIDDIIVGGNTKEELRERRKKVLEILNNYKLILNEEKCYYEQERIRVLGYILSKDKVECDLEKVEQLKRFGRIKTIKQLRQFLGELNWIRKFYPEIQKHMMILSSGLKSKVGEINVNWTEKLEKAHENILKNLKNPIDFQDYREGLKVELFTDAGEDGYAAIFKQETKIVGVVNHAWNKNQRNYSAMDKELTAIRFSLRQEGPRLLGRQIVIWTDNQALPFLWKNRKSVNSRVIRSLEELSEYDIDIKWKSREDSTIKLVDGLGRRITKAYMRRFEPNGFYWKTKLENHRVTAMIGSGASYNFISDELVRRLNLRTRRCDRFEVLGTEPFVVDKFVIVNIQITQNVEKSVKLYVHSDAISQGEYIILGEEWMREYVINWDLKKDIITIQANETNFLLKLLEEDERGLTKVEKLRKEDIVATISLPGNERGRKFKIPIRLYGNEQYELDFTNIEIVETQAPSLEFSMYLMI